MNKAKILLVDDDPDLVEAMRIALDEAGYECVHAHNGPQALELLPLEQPALMVLDVMMDDLTEGFQVVYRIRRPEPGLAHFAKIPIIMITSITRKTGMKFDPLTDGDFLPVDDFVERPVQPTILVEKVRTLLERRSA
jgi:CheY-like chemotaxis protein